MYDSDGFDTFHGGAGNDTIYGGSGLDTIWGDAGNDTLYGGSEEDNFLFADGFGSDSVIGGEYNGGNDRLDFSAVTAPVTVVFTGNEAGTVSSDQGSVNFSEIEALTLTAQDDSLDASAATTAVTAVGGAGNDTLIGSSADNDSLSGGDGDDSIAGGAGNDRLFGGTGNDVVEGGDGADSLMGDVGNDMLYGGAGNDLIDGGTGNDLLVGGGGADTLTGGVGNDTFRLQNGSGADVVTDFDIADADGNGFTNDQFDLSGLLNAQGEPITVRDVTVTDDGLGNARLMLPSGDSVVIQGMTAAQMTASQMHAMGIPCFTAGTMILTPTGEVPLETLRVGDLVCTRDNGPQPLRWLAMRRLGPADLAAAPRLRPVHIAPGAFGNDRALTVSPQHGMVLGDPARGGGEALVRAVHLARMQGGRVRVMWGVRKVTYVHLMFDAHQVLFANGLASESFYPGPEALATLDGAPLAELAGLFPCLFGAEGTYGPRVRPALRRRDLPEHLSELRALR